MDAAFDGSYDQFSVLAGLGHLKLLQSEAAPAAPAAIDSSYDQFNAASMLLQDDAAGDDASPSSEASSGAGDAPRNLANVVNLAPRDLLSAVASADANITAADASPFHEPATGTPAKAARTQSDTLAASPTDGSPPNGAPEPPSSRAPVSPSRGSMPAWCGVARTPVGDATATSAYASTASVETSPGVAETSADAQGHDERCRRAGTEAGRGALREEASTPPSADTTPPRAALAPPGEGEAGKVGAVSAAPGLSAQGAAAAADQVTETVQLSPAAAPLVSLPPAAAAELPDGLEADAQGKPSVEADETAVAANAAAGEAKVAEEDAVHRAAVEDARLRAKAEAEAAAEAAAAASAASTEAERVRPEGEERAAAAAAAAAAEAVAAALAAAAAAAEAERVAAQEVARMAGPPDAGRRSYRGGLRVRGTVVRGRRLCHSRSHGLGVLAAAAGS